MGQAFRLPAIDLTETYGYIDNVFGNELHVKLVESLSHATFGLIKSLSLAIHLIGEGLAQGREMNRKHCIKQVDRLFGNPNLNVWELFEHWVPYVLADRKTAMIAMDWTEFDKDDHSTLMLSLLTTHGRSTPLLWKTFKKSGLKGKRNESEDELLLHLRAIVPENVKVTLIADRGFGDTKLFEMLKDLEFGYVIRFRENMYITDPMGIRKKASEWVGGRGKARSIRAGGLTQWEYEVPLIVCVKQSGMQDAWCLAASDGSAKAKDIMTLYGKRWGIESTFRDIKDYKFGMGMSHMHTKSESKRDRLFLVSALAIVLLTLLGAAGDAAGLERTIKANTSKKRTYSFFRQGCIYYKLLPGSMKDWKQILLMKFHEMLSQHAVFRNTLGII